MSETIATDETDECKQKILQQIILQREKKIYGQQYYKTIIDDRKL